ncbi:MAG: NAD(P)H-binding protein [Polyangiaceae bacterium]
MSSAALLVTGASGHLGRRVLELLLEAQAGPLVATTRKPDALADLAARGVEVRAADFDDPETLAAAFRGVGRALLVSTDTLGEPGRRLRQHRQAVRALEAAGVEHVVYTSLTDAARSSILLAPDHAGTEAALAESKLDFTVLRNNCYADILLETLPPAVKTGQLVDARGAGKIAWVTREDCARVAATVLADRAAGGRRTLEVTGPDAVSSDELASIASELGRKAVTHVAVPREALVQGMVEHGLPRRWPRSSPASTARPPPASWQRSLTPCSGSPVAHRSACAISSLQGEPRWPEARFLQRPAPVAGVCPRCGSRAQLSARCWRRGRWRRRRPR